MAAALQRRVSCALARPAQALRPQATSHVSTSAARQGQRAAQGAARRTAGANGGGSVIPHLSRSGTRGAPRRGRAKFSPGETLQYAEQGTQALAREPAAATPEAVLHSARALRRGAAARRSELASSPHHANSLHNISSVLNAERARLASLSLPKGAPAAVGAWRLPALATLARESATATSAALSAGAPPALSLAHRRLLGNVSALAEPLLQRASQAALSAASRRFASDAGFSVRYLALGSYANMALATGLFLWGDSLREAAVAGGWLAAPEGAASAAHAGGRAPLSADEVLGLPAPLVEEVAPIAASVTTATTCTSAETASVLSEAMLPRGVQELAAQASAALFAPDVDGVSPVAVEVVEGVQSLLELLAAAAAPGTGQNGQSMLSSDAFASRRVWRDRAVQGLGAVEEETQGAEVDPAGPVHAVPFVGRHTLPVGLSRCLIAGTPALLLSLPALSDAGLVELLRNLSAAQDVVATGPAAGCTATLVDAVTLELGQRVAQRGTPSNAAPGWAGVDVTVLTAAAHNAAGVEGALPSDALAPVAGAAAFIPGLPSDVLQGHVDDVMDAASDRITRSVGGASGLLDSAAGNAADPADLPDAAADLAPWCEAGSTSLPSRLGQLAAQALAVELQGSSPAPRELLAEAIGHLHMLHTSRGGQGCAAPGEAALQLSVLRRLVEVVGEHEVTAGARGEASGGADDWHAAFADACEGEGAGDVWRPTVLEELLSSSGQAAGDSRRRTLALLASLQSPSFSAPPQPARSAPQGAPVHTSTPPSAAMHTQGSASTMTSRVVTGVVHALCAGQGAALASTLPLRELALLVAAAGRAPYMAPDDQRVLVEAVRARLGHAAALAGRKGRVPRPHERQHIIACAEFLVTVGGAHCASGLLSASALMARCQDWSHCNAFLTAAASLWRQRGNAPPSLEKGSPAALRDVAVAAAHAVANPQTGTSASPHAPVAIGGVECAAACVSLARWLGKRVRQAVAVTHGDSR